MWIETKTTKTGQTKYKYCDRFPHPVTGKPVRVSVTLSSKSRHAQKEAAQLLQDEFKKKTTTADQRRAKKAETLTFKELCSEWVEATRPSVKPQSILTRRVYIRKLLSTLPPDIRLMDMTPPILEKAFTTMYYTQRLSASYVFSILNLTKQVLRYAKKSRYIDDIRDYEDIRIKKRPPTAKELYKKAHKFLNAGELADCLQKIKNYNMRVGLAMEFISITGLRIGELLALRDTDCDLVNRSISVNGNIYIRMQKSSAIKRGTPKNVFSYRTVYVTQRACDIIEWFKADNMRLLRWFKGTYHDNGYIFTGKHGAPLCYSTIYATLRHIVIPNMHVTPHLFRHTYISTLSAKDIPLKAIMQQVGHNDPQTTLAIYTHVTDTMTEETRRKMDASI